MAHHSLIQALLLHVANNSPDPEATLGALFDSAETVIGNTNIAQHQTELRGAGVAELRQMRKPFEKRR